MNSFVSRDAAVLVSLPLYTQRGRQQAEKMRESGETSFFVISCSFKLASYISEDYLGGGGVGCWLGISHVLRIK